MSWPGGWPRPRVTSACPDDGADGVLADLPAWLQVGPVQVALRRAVGDEGGTFQVPQALVEHLGEDVVFAGRPLRGAGQVVGERVGGAVSAEADVAPPQLGCSQVRHPPCHEGEPAGGGGGCGHRDSFGVVPASRTVGAGGPTPSPPAGEPSLASARPGPSTAPRCRRRSGNVHYPLSSVPLSSRPSSSAPGTRSASSVIPNQSVPRMRRVGAAPDDRPPAGVAAPLPVLVPALRS